MKKNRFSQVMEAVTKKLQKLIELERETPRHQVEPKKEKQIRAFDEKKRRAFDPEDLEDQDKALDPGEREKLMEETLEELFQAHQAINAFAENTITAVHVLAQALLRSDPDMDPKVRAAVEYLTDVDLWGDDPRAPQRDPLREAYYNQDSDMSLVRFEDLLREQMEG